MSEQDTTFPLHRLFTAFLISSTTLKPLTEFMFGPAVFSPVKPFVSSSKIDPSQPCHCLKINPCDHAFKILSVFFSTYVIYCLCSNPLLSMFKAGQIYIYFFLFPSYEKSTILEAKKLNTIFFVIA